MGLYKEQIKNIQIAKSDKWDIALLVRILRTKKFEEIQLSKELEKIRKIRNEIQHMSNFHISDSDFEEKSNILYLSMIALGVSEEKIKEKKNSITIPHKEENSESENLKKFLDLKEIGNKFFIDKLYDEALKVYEEAINLNQLKNSDKSILLSNKAICFFEKYKLNKNKEFLEESKGLAKLSILANSSYFKAYYRVALVYEELKKNEKAKIYFNKCLALDPSNKIVLEKLDQIKYLEMDMNLQQHLNPDLFPKTMEEIHQDVNFILQERFGENLPCNGNVTNETLDLLEKFIPGNKDMVMAHKYKNGSIDCPQNILQAIHYYSKAAHKGNPEGMYNLALVTLKGQEIKQDISAAVSLLEKASILSATIKINGRKFDNIGVKESQHQLALMYQNGVYFERNYSKAIEFYEKATLNNHGYSANNLGIMYDEGIGVEKNLDIAEKLYLRAISLNDPNASHNLTKVYINKGYPFKALKIHEKAIEKNCFHSKKQDSEIRKCIEKMIVDFNRSGIEEWEIKNSIPFDNMSYIDRNDRYNRYHKPISNILNSCTPEINSKEFDYSKYEFISNKYDLHKLEECAKNGSITANRMLKCIQSLIHCYDILILNKNLTDEENKKMINNFAQAIESENSMCNFVNIFNNYRDILLNVCENIIYLKQINDLDKNARLCKIYLDFQNYNKNSTFCDECIKIYPNYPFFYCWKGSMLCFQNKYSDSIFFFDEGLKLCSQNNDMLYNKAASLRIINSKDTIIAYEKYLLYSEKDNRKYPEAYYGISAFLYQNKEDINEVRKYYDLGINAEKDQLFCYLPYNSTSKESVKNYIELFQPKDSLSFFKTNIQHDIETDYLRIQLILDNRKSIQSYNKHREKYKNGTFINKNITRQKNIKHNFNNLKKTYFRDLDTTYDHIIKGFFLEIVVIDLLLYTGSSHMTVIEDENKDVHRLAIYKLPFSAETDEKLRIGTVVRICNPYMRMAADGEAMIRVDDLEAIEILFNINKPCYVCMKRDTNLVCSKCKMANYCSKECQLYDWNTLKHTYVCVKNNV